MGGGAVKVAIFQTLTADSPQTANLKRGIKI